MSLTHSIVCQVEERAQALGTLPQMSSAKVVELLPCASLVNALAILPPSKDAAVMTAVSKDKMETARKAVELTRASVVDRAALISKMSPDQVGEALEWVDPKCSCEVSRVSASDATRCRRSAYQSRLGAVLPWRMQSARMQSARMQSAACSLILASPAQG